MALRDDMEEAGNWLFRWRSYLPLFLIVPMVLAMQHFAWPFDSHLFHEIWEFSCLGVSFLGLAIRCMTVGHTPAGTSGRNTMTQVADRLNTTGMYSIVRHPLYLGNALIWLGIASFAAIWWLVAIFVLAFWLYYERIMLAEERYLRRKFGHEFEVWAYRTPAFLLRFSGWQAPSLPFSLRNVLRREYTAFLAIIACFFTLHVAEHLVIQQRLVLEPIYIALLTIGVFVFVTLRTLKRHSRLLHVEGR